MKRNAVLYTEYDTKTKKINWTYTWGPGVDGVILTYEPSTRLFALFWENVEEIIPKFEALKLLWWWGKDVTSFQVIRTGIFNNFIIKERKKINGN